MIKRGPIPEPSQLAEAIRRDIVETGMKSGTRLPTHEKLARRYGVGLRRLREALSILRREGWVETRRRGGTVVTEPELNVLNEPIRWHLDARGYTYDDLLEARAAVESVVAAAAAKRRTRRDLFRIVDAVEQFEETLEPGRAAEQADEAFHQAVLRASHNPVLQIFSRLITEQFSEKKRRRRFTTEQRKRRIAREHRAILEHIEKRRATEAQHQMYKHVLRHKQDIAKRKSRKK
jgi:GntR family transcriptional repressor for pyruvate dehydrogenase complex